MSISGRLPAFAFDLFRMQIPLLYFEPAPRRLRTILPIQKRS
jgi:hypothetical protein